MRKKLFGLLLFVFSFVFITNVNAGSLSINARTSTIYVGNTIDATVKFSNIAGRFKITSSDQSILAGGNEDFYDNQTSTFTFTAKKEGTVTITVSPVGTIGDYDNEVYTGGSRSLTIRVIKKTQTPSIDVNKTYSKNNYLNSLSIEEYEIIPEFNKEKNEYEVTLEPGTEEININASVEDKNASIKGVGKVKITEGINTIKIVVTAENGNERTYQIIANSPEKDPINVKIGGKKYTVIKRKELIGSKSGYEESEEKINGFTIPSLYNEVTKVTLVGVKDEDGNITLVSYDSKTGDYELYNEFTFDIMNLYIHEKEDSQYKPIKLDINGVSTTGYKLDGVDDFYLVYATNTVTGYEGYYIYDKKENSVQRYDTTAIDSVTSTKDKFLSMVLVLSCVCFLTMLFLLIEVNRDNKRNTEE